MQTRSNNLFRRNWKFDVVVVSGKPKQEERVNVIFSEKQ